MDPDVKKLDEVVITALGVSKEKKALGYSVSEVSGGDLVRSGETNIIQSLAVKAPGVQVIGSGGTPGASSKILIRGNSTFTGNNQPLIVVDGVPINNETDGTIGRDYPFNSNLSGVNNSNRAIDLNPEDIESVTILKGAAAAALYGVGAGNGAIVYTTKRGKATKGKGVSVTFSTSIGFDQVNKLPALQDKYAQGVGGGDLMFGSDSASFIEGDQGPDGEWFTADDISGGTSASWGPEISSLGVDANGKTTQDPAAMVGDAKAYDNMDAFFQTGITTNNNLSITGGNEVTTYRLSIGNSNQRGVVPNTQYKRTSVRITTDTRLSDKITLGSTVNYINSGGIKAQNGSNLSGVMLGLSRAPASYDLTGGSEDGWKLPNGLQRQYFFPYDNPYWTVYENPFTDNVNRILGNVNLNYQALDWLSFSYRLGTDVFTDSRKQIFAVGSWDPPNPTGQIGENTQKYRELYQDIIVTAQGSLTDKINGRLSVGNNLYQKNYQDLYARGRELSVPGFYNLSNAADLYSSAYFEDIRTAAVFFEGSVDYDNFLYLNFTGRNEWASTFGPNKNNFFYPSVSSSFVFSNFIADEDILTFGKLRASFAQVGINPDPYSYNTYFVNPFFTDGFTDGLSFPYLGVNGFGYSDIIGDPNLQPELVTELEVGTDLRFFQGRLLLDVTYYNRKSSNILMSRPIPASSGYEELFSNFGEMVNKGWEIYAGGNVIESDDFTWNLGVNFTKNVNEVLSLADGVEEVNIEAAFASIGSYAIVGQPYGALYATKWERDENDNLIIDPNSGLPIVALEEGNVGNPFPDWTAGVTNSFTYKGVTLSALIDIRQGGDIWCGTCARLNQLGRTEESADRERSYTVDGVLAQTDPVTGAVVYNDPADDQSPTVVPTTTANDVEISAFNYYRVVVGDAGGSATENAVFDGSWIRLRELSLSYRWKNPTTFLQYIDFSATGRNLWLSTDYPGVDPETSLTGAGSNVSGFDYFNMPGTKSYMFGLKFGF